MEEWCSDGGVADDFESSFVRGAGDCGHIEDEAVGVAGGFDIDIDLSALVESVFVFDDCSVVGVDEVLFFVSVEELDCDVEV